MFDSFSPLVVLLGKIAEVVVGYNDSVCLAGQAHNESVIVTDDPLVPNATRWRESQNRLDLQLVEDLLVCDGVLRSRGLSSPLGYKHGYLPVPPVSEPINSYLDPSAREHSAIPVSECGGKDEEREREMERGGENGKERGGGREVEKEERSGRHQLVKATNTIK